MAGKHLFEQGKPNRYRLVLHRVIPTGNNKVNKKWSDVLAAEGITGKTALSPSTKVTSIVNVLDGKGDPIPVLDEFGEPVLDEKDDPVYQTETQIDEVVGIGQISDAEKAQIDDGSRFEIVGVVKLSGQPTQASLTKSATVMFADWQHKMKQKYDLYGHTQS